MSANESEVGSPESRLREASKQISIAADDLPDHYRFQHDLEAALSLVESTADDLEEA